MGTDAFLKLADRATILYAAVSLAVFGWMTFATTGVTLPPAGVVGGDFLAFYTAGEFAARGEAIAAYDLAAFEAGLRVHAPDGPLGMMWQYPPTVFFLVAPLSLLPYKAAYVLWCAATWALFAFALRRAGFSGRTLRLMVLSPPCLFVIVSGQISFLTGALLVLAAWDPKNRWVTAGLAAALLTVKPQLGLLVPFAYAACGAWRAFALAAGAALVFHAPSLAVFGVEGWRDFLAAAARLNADVTGAALRTPPENMTTLFGQLRILGAPASLATAAQYAASLGVVAAVALVWRRSGDASGKAAILCAGAILASPYAYLYEMVALLPAAVWLAQRAEAPFSLRGLGLLACWFALVAALPLLPERFPLQTSFLVTAAIFAMTLAALIKAPARKEALSFARPSVL